jgi:hypothetical protein
MTPKQLMEAMRAAAEKATPGLWKCGSELNHLVFVGNGLKNVYDLRGQPEVDGSIDGYNFAVRPKDGPFIAQCSPQNILSLLDAVEELVGAVTLISGRDWAVGKPNWDAEHMAVARRALEKWEGK